MVKNNSLFNQTKFSLTRWYVSIFTGILSLTALGVYEAIAHAHHVTINEELNTVANTFHSSFEPLLKEVNKLDNDIKNILTGLCFAGQKCLNLNNQNKLIQQEKYYFHFFSLSGELIATAGLPTETLPLQKKQSQLITFKDKNDIRYRQITLLLHTKNQQEWGYLQIGRSLKDFDKYVDNIKWFLLLGLPLLIVIVIIASWYLADKSMQPLYLSYQQRSQFSSDVAHELRTPLSAIKATIDHFLLRKNFTLQDTEETLNIIHRQNQRLITLVNDLLILNRLDSFQNLDEQNYYRKTNVNLVDLINDLIEEYTFLALQNKINFHQEIANHQHSIIQGNEEQIYRLVTNLVINAIQNTPENGEVILSLTSNKKEVIIKIIDTGIGIDTKEQKLIFNRFYRINKARSTDKGGSGLGLAIALAIANNHGGRIDLKSNLNKGSIFTIYLPYL